MRLSRGIKAILGLGALAYARRAVERAGDERNIRALARHLGCSVDDARRLYVASRQDGYGAAYQKIFPGGLEPRGDRSAPKDPVVVHKRHRGHDRPVHR